MTSKHSELPADIAIVGLALHTSPERAGTEIPAHWQRFMAENIAERIRPHGDDPHLYCVYCDYASDYRGPYTMVLGHAIDAGADVPAGLRRVRIPAGKYAVFTFEGDPTKVITGTWNDANERWAGRRQRRYIADFERYLPGAMTPTSVAGSILIGVS